MNARKKFADQKDLEKPAVYSNIQKPAITEEIGRIDPDFKIKLRLGNLTAKSQLLEKEIHLSEEKIELLKKLVSDKKNSRATLDLEIASLKSSLEKSQSSSKRKQDTVDESTNKVAKLSETESFIPLDMTDDYNYTAPITKQKSPDKKVFEIKASFDKVDSPGKNVLESKLSSFDKVIVDHPDQSKKEPKNTIQAVIPIISVDSTYTTSEHMFLPSNLSKKTLSPPCVPIYFYSASDQPTAPETIKKPSQEDIPILCKGILRHLSDPSPKKLTRQEISNLEAIVKENPSDIKVWLELFQGTFPSPIKDWRSNSLNISLNYLSRGIEKNRHSKELWYVYLDVYFKRSTNEQSKAILKVAIKFCEQDMFFCWRLYQISDLNDKRNVLKQMHSLGPDIDVICNLISLVAKDDFNAAVDLAFGFLFAKTADEFNSVVDGNIDIAITESLKSTTFLSDVWSNEKECLLYLVYLFMKEHGHFPEIFYDYPYNYKVKQELFVIKRKNGNCLKHFKVCKTLWRECKNKYVLKCWQLNSIELRETVLESYESEILSTRDLILAKPFDASNWNRLAKLGILTDNYSLVYWVLINNPRAYFTGSRFKDQIPTDSANFDEMIKETRRMYQVILNVDGKYTKVIEKLQMEGKLYDTSKVNEYLKIHYLAIMSLSIRNLPTLDIQGNFTYYFEMIKLNPSSLNWFELLRFNVAANKSKNLMSTDMLKDNLRLALKSLVRETRLDGEFYELVGTTDGTCGVKCTEIAQCMI